ncbi:substrate-binding domain-containing protein [Chloroflexota bacterium]
MIEIQPDQRPETPLYKQIAEQVRQLIATSRLKPGERLPAVRQLANSLDISPGTVVRAYLELEQEQIVVSRRGGGTIVTAKANDPGLMLLRQRRLNNLVGRNILEMLSLGYSPEELETAFFLHLARWREEHRSKTAVSDNRLSHIDTRNTIVISGSHDIALFLLVGQLREKTPEINIEINNAGSLGGLIALQEKRADLAGIHLLDEETGEYNYPYVKHILPGREVAIVHLAYRIQGLMFEAGNPKQIQGIEDLSRPDITMVNRQQGSGTRVLLDFKLRQIGITPSEVKGYERETDTHLEVATAIAGSEADVGLGIEAAANACSLGFLPIFREKYDLVVPIANYRSRLLAPLLETIASEEFRKVVNNAGGYDTSQTGAVTFCKYDS